MCTNTSVLLLTCQCGQLSTIRPNSMAKCRIWGSRSFHCQYEVKSGGRRLGTKLNRKLWAQTRRLHAVWSGQLTNVVNNFMLAIATATATATATTTTTTATATATTTRTTVNAHEIETLASCEPWHSPNPHPYPQSDAAASVRKCTKGRDRQAGPDTLTVSPDRFELGLHWEKSASEGWELSNSYIILICKFHLKVFRFD